MTWLLLCKARNLSVRWQVPFWEELSPLLRSRVLWKATDRVEEASITGDETQPVCSTAMRLGWGWWGKEASSPKEQSPHFLRLSFFLINSALCLLWIASNGKAPMPHSSSLCMLIKTEIYCFQHDQIGGANRRVLLRVKHSFKRWNQDKYGLDQNWNRMKLQGTEFQLCRMRLRKSHPFHMAAAQSARPGRQHGGPP